MLFDIMPSQAETIRRQHASIFVPKTERGRTAGTLPRELGRRRAIRVTERVNLILGARAQTNIIHRNYFKNIHVGANMAPQGSELPRHESRGAPGQAS
jgi:hypothetical protein